MTKTSIIIAALAGLLLAGSAAPSFAESLAACQPDRSWDMADSNNNSLDSDAGIVASRLRAEGSRPPVSKTGTAVTAPSSRPPTVVRRWNSSTRRLCSVSADSVL